MTGFPPNPVILVTPVITAIGCDDWGDGNPEERSQPPVGHLIKMRAPWIQPRSATGVGVGRVNGAEASGFDADGINRKTTLFFTGFPSKLENDGARRRRPPEGAGTLHRQDQRRRESRGTLLSLTVFFSQNPFFYQFCCQVSHRTLAFLAIAPAA